MRKLLFCLSLALVLSQIACQDAGPGGIGTWSSGRWSAMHIPDDLACDIGGPCGDANGKESGLQAFRGAQAAKIQELIRHRTGDRYQCNIDEPDRVILASPAHEPLDQAALDALSAQGAAEHNDLFSHTPMGYVTVVVLDQADARRMSRDSGGFYDYKSHTILTVQTGIILRHEFTHALHHADAQAHGQQHPVWIKEGLATLFESSHVGDGHIVPLDNFRLRAIQRAAAENHTVPWRAFFSYTQDQYMRKARVRYPQGRYIMMYLYQNGLLKKWYDAYVASYAADPSGAAAIERVFGKDLRAVEADWLAWLGHLDPSEQDLQRH